MLALVVVLLVVVALLSVVVTGLLRSHADIARSLHSLGVGLGDPSATGEHENALPRVQPAAVPTLPAERSRGVHDLEGVTPAGEAIVISVDAAERTLLAFITSGCETCSRLWSSLADPTELQQLLPGTRVVAVTRGPEWESPAAVAGKRPKGATVVMSSSAWADYEVPGAPYVVLIDGATRSRVGEGVGYDLAQIATLVGRARADEVKPSRSRGRAFDMGLSGAEREAYNDEVLESAGILPGHPSLYPRTIDDVFRAPAPAEREIEPNR